MRVEANDRRDMADMLEQVRLCQCRIRRRRWVGLAVTWAICALGWILYGLVPAERSVAQR